MELQMLHEKEVKLIVPKSLMMALWLIAGGLLLNSLHVFGVSAVNASNGEQKVAICTTSGQTCADIFKLNYGSDKVLGVYAP